MSLNLALLLIYPVFFLILYWNLRKYKDNTTYKYIIWLYLAGAISACYIKDLPGLEYKDMPLSFTAILYHCLMMFLLLLPFRDYCKFSSAKLKSSNEMILVLLIAIIVPISLYYIVQSFISLDLNMIFIDVAQLRKGLLEADSDSGTLNTYLQAFSNTFHGLALSLAFYYIVKAPQKKMLIALLILCSLSQVIHSLNFAAREYVVKYVFVFIMLMLLLKDKISSQWKTSLKRMMVVFGSLILVFFVAVTIFRFTISEHYDNPLDSIFAYLGQGMVQFSHRFLEYPDGVFGGQQLFPIFTGGEKVTSFNVNSVVDSEFFLNTFSTTIGSWVFDCGIFYATLLTVVHYLLFKVVGKLQFNIFTIYYLIYAYEFIFSCIFFYNDTIGKLRLETLAFIIILNIINNRIQDEASKKNI